jgi:hypothetical protein
MLAFELVDGDDNLVDFLTFPVLPDTIQRNSQSLVNIKKTMKGTTTILTSSFVPFDITISGTFGRQLKFLIGSQELNFAGLRYSTQSGVWKKQDVFRLNRIKTGISNINIKTGYGVTKLLEAILSKSESLDGNGKPMRLYFYNSVFGESNVVIVQSFDVSQNKDSNNGMWTYSIKMKAIAPLTLIANTKNTVEIAAFSFIQQSINSLARIARSI